MNNLREAFEKWALGRTYKPFEVVEWTLEQLSAQSGEFDESAALKYWMDLPPEYSPIDIARWQFERDRVRIAAANAMKGEYLLRAQDYAQSVTAFADKIKSLEAQIREGKLLSEADNRRIAELEATPTFTPASNPSDSECSGPRDDFYVCKPGQCRQRW